MSANVRVCIGTIDGFITVFQRYDVGMSSMVAMELEALANLSITAFNPPRTKDHALLTSRLAELSGR